jgi:hypothetical protein
MAIRPQKRDEWSVKTSSYEPSHIDTHSVRVAVWTIPSKHCRLRIWTPAWSTWGQHEGKGALIVFTKIPAVATGLQREATEKERANCPAKGMAGLMKLDKTGWAQIMMHVHVTIRVCVYLVECNRHTSFKISFGYTQIQVPQPLPVLYHVMWLMLVYPLSHCVRHPCYSLCNIQSGTRSFRSLSLNQLCNQHLVWPWTQAGPGGMATEDVGGIFYPIQQSPLELLARIFILAASGIRVVHFRGEWGFEEEGSGSVGEWRKSEMSVDWSSSSGWWRQWWWERRQEERAKDTITGENETRDKAERVAN